MPRNAARRWVRAGARGAIARYRPRPAPGWLPARVRTQRHWLYWYDTPAKYATGTWPEPPWFDAVPTVWDESHALDGRIGRYVVVARRSGRTWYLGAMTNEQGRVLDVPLTFLGKGSFQATIDADGAPGAAPNATPVVVSTRTVTSSGTLSMLLAPSGGQAVTLTPS